VQIDDFRTIVLALIILAVFWQNLCELTLQVVTDIQVMRLKRDLAASLHAEGSAYIAYLLLVERKSRK
jgi:hypothetical protein